MSESTVRFDLTDPRQLLAVGLGSGFAPLAPGTAGSAAALPLIVILALLPWTAYLVVVAIALMLGVWFCGATARAVGVHDHSAIVWDEIAGMLVAMIAMPVNAWSLAAAFGLFRLFDVVKPWPIRWLDRHIGGGWGIMLDDILAGVVALACLQGLRWVSILPGT